MQKMRLIHSMVPLLIDILDPRLLSKLFVFLKIIGLDICFIVQTSELIIFRNHASE